MKRAHSLISTNNLKMFLHTSCLKGMRRLYIRTWDTILPWEEGWMYYIAQVKGVIAGELHIYPGLIPDSSVRVMYSREHSIYADCGNVTVCCLCNYSANSNFLCKTVQRKKSSCNGSTSISWRYKTTPKHPYFFLHIIAFSQKN